MRRSLGGAGAIALVSVLALGFTPSAKASLFDANCPYVPPFGSTGSHTPDGREAQTFTALHTGKLIAARLLINNSGFGGDFQLQILAAGASGPINGVLGSVTIPDATLPPGDVFLDGHFVPPVPIVAGQEYALVVTRPGGAPYNVRERSGDPCEGRKFFSSTQGGSWAADDPAFDDVFEIFVDPPNDITVGRVTGRKLIVTVPAPGLVAFNAVRSGPRGPDGEVRYLLRYLQFVQVTATAAGPVEIPLRLTKRGKGLLKRNGKLKVKADIGFTPTGGPGKSISHSLVLR